MENKIDTVLMPGCLQKKETYKGFNVFDIWGKNLDLKYDKNVDYIVGHSVGANLALYVWENNKNQKLILVNPLFPKRSLFVWFWRWVNDFPLEDVSRINLPNFKSLKNLIFLLKLDPLKTLSKIPKDNIVILRGKKDYYICDEESVKTINKEGINIIEFDDNHEWSDIYANEVNKILDIWKKEKVSVQ